MNYVFILSYFIILFSLTILVESATNARYAHTSALIKDQLFIIGGQPISSQIRGSNDVFYLDLTKPFTLQDPPLIDITKTSGLPLSISWASSTVFKKDGILLYGGFMWSLNGNLDTGDNSLYLYNTTTKQWSIPTVSGASPPRRREMKIVSDNNNNIYIYSGIQLGINPQWFTDMNILNANDQFKWELVKMNNAPPYPRADYTVTMLPNGVIVYIGGRTRVIRNGLILDIELNIRKLTLYDTKDATWYPMETGGELLDDRNSHSAVLTPDGKIIIYGGVKGVNLTTASPSLAILDTSTSVYTWSVPQISSQFSPPPLMLHTADLYGDHMIVTFGNITNNETSPVEVNSNIYILDTKTFSWIGSYTPNLTSSPDDQTSIGLIIGIVCAALVFIVIAGVIGWFLYKKYKKNQRIRNSVIATPGSEADGAERGDGDDYSNNRISNITNITSVTDNSNNENHRNSSTTDVTVISHSRPPSTYKIPTFGSTYQVPPYTPANYYTPHGGFTSNNPPYSSRN